MMAVSGRIVEGVTKMEEAISLVINDKEKYTSWSAQLVAMQDPSYVEFLKSDNVDGTVVSDWVGEVADRRIGKFGGNCEVQLIWY